MRQIQTFLLLILLALPGGARAQDTGQIPEGSSGGFVVRMLEDALSSENGRVRVQGLSGVLSARTTIDRVEVSDDRGVWLTIEKAELDWNRRALLQGRFAVNQLEAARIHIARRPGPSKTTLPAPEAQPFALPALPVSVEIGQLGVGRLELDAALAGEAAVLQVAGALRLDGGVLDTDIRIDRLDRAGDSATLKARYAEDSQQIDLALRLDEAAGGLVSRSLSIPDLPPVTLRVEGSGPVSDFTADLHLATDGQERLGGQMTLRGADAERLDFALRVAGDVKPMLHPDYHPFFGDSTDLTLIGQRAGNGALRLDRLSLRTAALGVNGTLALAPAGTPERVSLTIRMAPKAGDQVVLPLTGPRTALRALDLTARFDAARGEDWTITGRALGLTRPDLTAERVALNARGTYDLNDSGALNGAVQARLSSLSLTDPGLQQAVGSALTLDGGFRLLGGVLDVSDLRLKGADYAGAVSARIDGLDSGYDVEGSARLRFEDLSRLAGLTGQPLRGALDAQLSGTANVLGGGFDLRLTGEGLDLGLGQAKLDALVAGPSRVTLEAARGTDGITLRAFDLRSTALSAQASGTLSSAASDLRLSAVLDDLARLVPEAPGPLRATGTLSGRDGGWSGDVDLTTSGGSFARLKGTADSSGQARLAFEAALKRLERFVPGFPGALTATGTATRQDAAWRFTAKADGPAGIDATLEGSYAETTGRINARSRGRAQLAAANRFVTPVSVAGQAEFDLRLNGKPALEALTGQITTSGANVAIPQIQNGIRDLTARVALNGTRATLGVTGSLRDGGRLSVAGPVGLLPPFDGALDIGLTDLILTDRSLYRFAANAALRYAGPLAGNGRLSGRVDIGESEIDISNAGGGANAAPIPPITHIGAPPGVQATLRRAGLGTQARAASGPSQDIALDIAVSAPNRIFVRGRGLEAELGGQLLVRGSTLAVAPSGQIGLIRGVLELFGRRLALDTGKITLEGNLRPYLEFAARSEGPDGSATLKISGPPSDLEIDVSAEPDRSDEEALAILLFGSRAADLSPLKLAQIAASLNRLRGGGSGLNDSARAFTGADSVSIAQDEDGNPSIGVGGYLSENVYTDVNVNSQGDAELNINLDVTDNLTLKGSVDNGGEGGIGIFFERDY